MLMLLFAVIPSCRSSASSGQWYARERPRRARDERIPGGHGGPGTALHQSAMRVRDEARP